VYRPSPLPWAILVFALLFIVSLASEASAAPTWPGDSDWIALTDASGDNFADPRGDTGPKERDIVGLATDSSGKRRGAGFWFYDAGQDVLFFRIRVDKSPLDRGGDFKNNHVWTVLIDDQDNDDRKGWALQLDTKDDDVVELEAVEKMTDKIDKLKIKNSNEFEGDLDDYARAVVVNNSLYGDDFGGEDDYFIDIAIDYQDFEDATGLTTTDGFRIALVTSDKDDKIKKDLPFDLDKNDRLFQNNDQGWGELFAADDAVTAPEPGTWALFGLGLLALGLRVRRRKCPGALPKERISA